MMNEKVNQTFRKLKFTVITFQYKAEENASSTYLIKTTSKQCICTSTIAPDDYQLSFHVKGEGSKATIDQVAWFPSVLLPTN